MGLGNNYFVEVDCFPGGLVSPVEDYPGFDVF